MDDIADRWLELLHIFIPALNGSGLILPRKLERHTEKKGGEGENDEKKRGKSKYRGKEDKKTSYMLGETKDIRTGVDSEAHSHGIMT